MADLIHVKTISVPSSYVAMLSQAQAVSDHILSAAVELTKKSSGVSRGNNPPPVADQSN